MPPCGPAPGGAGWDQQVPAAADPGSGGTWAAAPHEQQRRGGRWRRRAGSEPSSGGVAVRRDLRSGARRGRAAGAGTPGSGPAWCLRLPEDLRRGLPGPWSEGLTRAAAEVLIARPGERGFGPAPPLWPSGPGRPAFQLLVLAPRPAISKALAAPRGDPFASSCKGAGPGRRWSLLTIGCLGYKLSSLHSRSPDASPGRPAVGGGEGRGLWGCRHHARLPCCFTP